MKDIIKQQLNSLKVAQIPKFDDNTTEIIIKKLSNIPLLENHYYIIKLNDSLLIPNNNSALTINWNGGSVPKNKYYKIDVIKIMAQMIKINGLAFDYDNKIDLNKMWSGWLPLNSIEILEKI